MGPILYPRPLTLAYGIFLLPLMGCATSNWQSEDQERHRRLETLRADLPRFRKEIDEDDVALRHASETRSLKEEDRKRIDAFIALRRKVLSRHESAIDKLEAIDKELHDAMERPASDDARSALETRLEQYRVEQRSIAQAWEELKQEDRLIENLITRAPKREK